MQRTDEDTIGLEEIGDSRSFRKELRVREDVESAARPAVRLEDGAHGLGRPARNSRFLDDNLGRSRHSGDATSSRLNIASRNQVSKDCEIEYTDARLNASLKAPVKRNLLEVGTEASSHTRLLRRRVDANEDELRLTDGLVDIRREEQVAAARLLHNLDETGLVDGQTEVWAVPRVDT